MAAAKRKDLVLLERGLASLLALAAVLLLVACNSSQAEQSPSVTAAQNPAALAPTTPPGETEDTPQLVATPGVVTATPAPRRTPLPHPAVTADPSSPYIPWYTKVEVYEEKVVIQDTKFAGDEIYFTVYNYGEAPHDVAVVSWDGDPVALPVNQATGEVSIQDYAGHWQVLNSGESEVFEIDPIAPGKYVMFCTLPGHYQQGEFAAFEVQAPR